MTQLLKWVESALKAGRTPVSPLESYIESKSPKSVAEVEYWMKQYYHSKGGQQ